MRAIAVVLDHSDSEHDVETSSLTLMTLMDLSDRESDNPTEGANRRAADLRPAPVEWSSNGTQEALTSPCRQMQQPGAVVPLSALAPL